MRAIEIAGVDMVDTSIDRCAQYRERGLMVLGRPEHAGTCKLHGAIAEPLDAAVAEGKASGLIEIGHGYLLLRRSRDKPGRSV